jgi:tetratricopeptide (TPR) repeat protein
LTAGARSDKDSILLADFVNTTGEAVFDGTLKQGLAVQLAQSPFLNLFPDTRVRETLRLMNRSEDEPVTTEIGREISERQGLKCLIAGTIAPLGSHYVITLEAVSGFRSLPLAVLKCYYVITLEAVSGPTGEVLAREQVEAESKEQVLKALSQAAAQLRETLGESLSSVEKFDVPIEAITSSLEALKAYSWGREQNSKGRNREAITFYKRAVELDPKFARAYSLLSSAYNNLGQRELGSEFAQKAFELRERASERA